MRTGARHRGVRIRIAAAILAAVSLAGAAAAQENKATAQGTAPAIGLEVGEKAPAFSAVDQFGREQTNESLRGANGTVLLMFRSADW